MLVRGDFQALRGRFVALGDADENQAVLAVWRVGPEMPGDGGRPVGFGSDPQDAGAHGLCDFMAYGTGIGEQVRRDPQPAMFRIESVGDSRPAQEF